jgi:intracellular multiplication protein IcmL
VENSAAGGILARKALCSLNFFYGARMVDDVGSESTVSEPIMVVQERNSFYRDNYRRVMMALLAVFVLVGLLSATLFYLVTHPPEPKYFAIHPDGTLIKLEPLSQPNMSPATLLQWANSAAIAVNTYNFVNYRQALQEASENFTPDGWQAYLQQLQSSNNLVAVTEKKLIVSAVATGAPVILQEGVTDGVYTWRVQMPMLITYQSASQVSPQSVVVTMLIVRVSPLNSARGIGIAQFVASGGSAGF